MDEKVLSSELIIAAEIYRLTDISHEDVYYSKLLANLKGKKKVSSSGTISKALNVLFDLGIACAEWKQLKNGRWARSLEIAKESKSFIKSVYEKVYNER